MIRPCRCSGCGRVWRQDTGGLPSRGLGISWNTGNDTVLAVGIHALIQGPHRIGGVHLIGAAVSSNPSVETAAASPLRSMPRSAPSTPAPCGSSRSAKSVSRPFSLSRSMSRSWRPARPTTTASSAGPQATCHGRPWQTRTPPRTLLPDPDPKEIHGMPVVRSRWIQTPTTPSIATSPYCPASHHDA